MGFLLDSVIIIDHLNEIDFASNFIKRHQKNISISLITRAEVLSGISSSGLSLTKQLLDRFPTLPITCEDADLAARLRQEYRWKLPDALQAAIAKNNKYKLVTRNTKDFNCNKHSFVSIPYELPTK